MSAPALQDVVTCPNLPSLPTVALELLEVTRDDDVPLDQIARVVQNDPALTAKILRTVNSSYYGLARPCSTISRALVYLGLSTVKSLVLSFGLVELTGRTRRGLDLVEYWRRSLVSAAAARRIAARSGHGDAEEAFIAALMQDIGMLAIHVAAGDQYHGLLAHAGADHTRLPGIEQQVLGFDHAQVGGRLGHRWRLPGSMVEAIERHHHAPTGSDSWLVRAVALGTETAAVCLAPPAEVRTESLAVHARAWFDYGDDLVTELLGEVGTDARELAGLLHVDAGPLPDPKHLLAAAEEASLTHHLAIQREQERLRQANELLSSQVQTDSLTGIANRRAFDEVLPARMAEAHQRDESVGLLLVDADHFKAINDIYGHPTGDAVLVELARRLGETVGERALVCRYGGEEFAVILGQTSSSEAAALAEAIRRRVSTSPLKLRGRSDELAMTVSIGVAVSEPSPPHGPERTADCLVAAADKALYAAKQAGRDCVRIFGPGRRISAA